MPLPFYLPLPSTPPSVWRIDVHFRYVVASVPQQPGEEAPRAARLLGLSGYQFGEWLTGLKATIAQLEKTMVELGVVKIKTVGEPSITTPGPCGGNGSGVAQV